MGQEISYCAKCAVRILSSDIEKGNAFRIGNQTVCKGCAPQVAPGLSKDELQRASQKTPRGGTPLPPAHTPREPVSAVTPRAMPRVGGPPAPSGTRRFTAEEPRRSRMPLFLGLGGAGIVLGLVVLVLVSGRSPAAAPPPAPSPWKKTAPDVEDANTRAARLACEKAFRFMKEHPGDLEGQIAAYEEAVRAAENTGCYEQARAARDALLTRRMGDITKEMTQLNEQARPLVEKEEFGAALELCRQARRKREIPEWTALVDGKIQEIQKSVEPLAESIQEQAVQDRLAGNAAGVKKARERVARWGLADRTAAFDAFLSGMAEARTLSRGLAGWWKMDEGSGTAVADASGQGRKGTLAGGAAWEEGRLGKALAFDGGQAHVRIHPFFESVRNTFTIALWALPRATLLVTPEGNTGAAPLKDHRFAVFPSHGKLFGTGHTGAGLSIGTNGISVFEHAEAHLPSLLVHPAAVRGWTHVAAVFTDREPVLYVNGERVKAGVKSSMEVHPSCELGGGSSRYGSYDGLLDDVRIYDRALSGAEVRALALRSGPPPLPHPPPPPPPPPEGGWRAIFDGKTNTCLRGICRAHWIVEKGGLTKTGPSDAAQTVEEFEDGEIRVRFEVEGPESLTFCIRQGEGGKYFVKLDSTSSVEALAGKPHEIVFTCTGDSVTAALDGNALAMLREGNPRKGCLQFNGAGRVIRILSIDYRPAR